MESKCNVQLLHNVLRQTRMWLALLQKIVILNPRVVIKVSGTDPHKVVLIQKFSVQECFEDSLRRFIADAGVSKGKEVRGNCKLIYGNVLNVHPLRFHQLRISEDLGCEERILGHVEI